MSDHRGEIFAMASDRIKDHSPELADEEVGEAISPLIDEIVGALERADGIPTDSPLPGRSPNAMHLGTERQHRGYSIDKLALDVGAISDSVGEIGKRHGMSFSAREYQVFNQCIDNAVSSAVDTFWSEAMQQYEEDSAKRLGFLVHELRNALAGAKASFGILKRTKLGVESKTGEVLGRSLGRLENLIDQTLLAVQLQSGIKAELRPLRVSRLLHEVQETAVPERGIQLKVEDGEEIMLDADERLLLSAASNLLQNAFKFTKDGGQITLRARRDGKFVLIEVEDECGGLPPGRAEELFKPYVQRNENRRGLGLGLAITREAVEAHGGELIVRNLPEKGCVFAMKVAARPPSSGLPS